MSLLTKVWLTNGSCFVLLCFAFYLALAFGFGFALPFVFQPPADVPYRRVMLQCELEEARIVQF